MHFISFRLKRAHHRSVRASMPFAAKHDLTPARVDLLFSIHKYSHIKHLGRSLEQLHLRRLLGIASSTLSRMLRGLEDKGFVRRERCPWDRRANIVSITDAGLARFRKAMPDVFGRHVLRNHYEKALRTRWPYAVCKLDELRGTLTSIGKVLGDRAGLWYYTGHPDD